MKNIEDCVFSARIKLFTNDKKHFLQLQLFTDIDYYKFSSMCNKIVHCNSLNQVITDTDMCLTKGEKAQIKFCEEDFTNTNYKDNFKKVAQKHWKSISPSSSFQIYVGDDYHAYLKILPFFNALVKYRESLTKKQNQEQTL